MMQWEYKDLVIHMAEKHLTLFRKDVAQGLDEGTRQALTVAGKEGWELVSVVAYPRTDGLISSSAIAFFKRPLNG